MALGLKTLTFRTSFPLNFLTGPNWLTVKCHYFIVGPKVQILNTFSSLVLITLDKNFKQSFVSVMNMLLIYLFASMKLEKRHKKITEL